MQSRLNLDINRWHFVVLALVIGFGLALTAPSMAYAQDGGDGDGADGEGSGYSSPDDCAACHEGAYTAWQESHHATALSDPLFLEARSRAGDPAYCNKCHATGYEPVTGEIWYEGVACKACHTPSDELGGPHMTIDNSADLCGGCHTGNHAPDYDEWLVSDHATMNIDCEDCHQSHTTDLRMEDPTQLCVSCHEMDYEDDVHGAEDMACHDCHMYTGEQVVDPLSGRRDGSGHTFGIPADACSSCHGMTHTLKAGEEETTETSSSADLEDQVSDLEQKASNNLNLGLAGGGIGGLLVGISIPFLLRRKEQK